MKYSAEELGRRVKQQYPQYADRSDAEVGAAMVKKYPQYAAKVERTQGINNWASSIPGANQLQNFGIGVGARVGQLGLGLGEAALKTGIGVTKGLSNLTGGFLKADTGLAEDTLKTLRNTKYALYTKPVEKNLQSTSGKAGETATDIGMYFAGGSGQVGNFGRLASAGLRAAPEMVVNAAQGGGAGEVTATGVASAVGNAIMPQSISTPLRTIVKNIGANVITGEVSDIGRGLAGLRGEDRTGMKSVIPGAGVATGLVFGAAQSIPQIRQVNNKGLSNSIRNEFQGTAQDIMNNVARVNPSDARKFQNVVGEDIGSFLVKRGQYGDDVSLIKTSYDEVQRSKGLVDDGLSQIGGKWKNVAIKDMLDELSAREARVSSPNVRSRDYSTVQQLIQKHNTEGLTMTEINQLKRMYEANVKMDYLRQNVSDGIARANNLDSAVREWQIKTAANMGFENLQEMNKNTQAYKMLGDALWKKTNGQKGNNALSLTDAVLLSGGDISNIEMFIARRIFGDKGVKARFAQAIAPSPTATPVQQKWRAPVTDPTQMLPANTATGYNPNINQGRAIPVFPNKVGASDYVGGENVVVRGNTTPSNPPKFGKPSQPIRPYDLYEPEGVIKAGVTPKSKYKKVIPGLPFAKGAPNVGGILPTRSKKSTQQQSRTVSQLSQSLPTIKPQPAQQASQLSTGARQDVQKISLPKDNIASSDISIHASRFDTPEAFINDMKKREYNPFGIDTTKLKPEDVALHNSFVDTAQQPKWQKVYEAGGNDDDVLKAIWESSKQNNTHGKSISKSITQADDLTGKTSKADDLLTEAKKYDSLEEFVDSFSLKHGAKAEFSKFDNARLGSGEGSTTYGKGMYLAGSEDADFYSRMVGGKTLSVKLDDNTKIAKLEDLITSKAVATMELKKIGVPETIRSRWNTYSPVEYFNNAVADMGSQQKNVGDKFAAILRKNGYDGMEYPKISGGGNFTVLWNTEKASAYTNKQLTDIWNKAHSKSN